jgi:hypothetical protein
LYRFAIKNDLYGLAVGLTIIMGSFLLSRYIAKEVSRNSDFQAFLALLWTWTKIAAKSVTLGAIWFTVIPLLIGLLLDAAIVAPLRTPLNESPTYSLVQCWAVGLLVLKIWLR